MVQKSCAPTVGEVSVTGTTSLLATPLGEMTGLPVVRLNTARLVALYNHRGLDKTQTGIARVDRKAFVDVELRTTLPVVSAKEWTGPNDLTMQKSGPQSTIRVRVHPGDVQGGISVR